MLPFGPGLKTAGFPQPERLYALSSLPNSTPRVNTCAHKKIRSRKIRDNVCKKLEHSANFIA